MTKKRIILVGKAGSGKDFFRDYILKNKKLEVAVSLTTRPIRNGEIQGLTYNFVSEHEFSKLVEQEKFYEYENFNNWFYGNLKSSWDSCNLHILTPSSIKKLSVADRKESFIIYFNIPEDIREERLKLRRDADGVERRLLTDKKDFSDFKTFDLEIKDPNFSCEVITDIIMEHIL